MTSHRFVRVGVLAVGLAMAVSACSSGTDLATTVAAELPTLTPQGLTSFECGTGTAIAGSFQAPSAPYVATCWRGSPNKTFQDIANSVADAVALATGGTNVTSDVCPDDSLSVGGGIACRAALVTKGSDAVLVRTVVILADPSTALKGLSDSPTQEEINDALTGAAIEVLVGTQSPTQASPTSAAS